MSWRQRLFSSLPWTRESETNEKDAEADGGVRQADSAPAETTVPAPDRPSQESGSSEHRPQLPTTAMTGHQLYYVFGLDGVGAMFLSGGINFAIAYGE
jgi:hypothetical protein